MSCITIYSIFSLITSFPKKLSLIKVNECFNDKIVRYVQKLIVATIMSVQKIRIFSKLKY